MPEPETVIGSVTERRDVVVDAIINPYVVTISGRAVALTSPRIGWAELTELLRRAAEVAPPPSLTLRNEDSGEWRGWMCVENKPGANVGDHVGEYDLRTCHRDFVLMPVKDLIHGAKYPAASRIGMMRYGVAAALVAILVLAGCGEGGGATSAIERVACGAASQCLKLYAGDRVVKTVKDPVMVTQAGPEPSSGVLWQDATGTTHLWSGAYLLSTRGQR